MGSQSKMGSGSVERWGRRAVTLLRSNRAHPVDACKRQLADIACTGRTTAGYEFILFRIYLRPEQLIIVLLLVGIFEREIEHVHSFEQRRRCWRGRRAHVPTDKYEIIEIVDERWRADVDGELEHVVADPLRDWEFERILVPDLWKAAGQGGVRRICRQWRARHRLGSIRGRSQSAS